MTFYFDDITIPTLEQIDIKQAAKWLAWREYPVEPKYEIFVEKWKNRIPEKITQDALDAGSVKLYHYLMSGQIEATGIESKGWFYGEHNEKKFAAIKKSFASTDRWRMLSIQGFWPGGASLMVSGEAWQVRGHGAGNEQLGAPAWGLCAYPAP